MNEKLKSAHEGNQFEPFIRHIRFPHFKNLSPMLKLEFDFPITAFVGPNGSNKSSILRAIASCPHYQNLGNYWFSTKLDPIDDSGGRPRYIFGYIDPTSQNIVEVIQSRIKKDKDPDYWEPSRPLIRDGMEKLPEYKSDDELIGRTGTRWSGIKKNIVLLDFRSEISAFDKLFYHGDFTEKVRSIKRKDLIRQRTVSLKKVADQELKSYAPHKGNKNKVQLNIELPNDQLLEISKIIGREYQSIRLIRHNLFDNDSHTALMSTGDLNYSEAFAGSGEFAVVMLVYKIMSAEERSLIILDEPEVSLHPGAQIKLMEFIAKQCLINKHQIFIGTHSNNIVKNLPPESIILLQPDSSTNKITAQQNVHPSEAFFHLGLPLENKKRIFVEDRLGEELVKKALRTLGSAAFNQFDIKAYPGGAQTIFSKLMPSLMQSGDTSSIYLLDGDQKPTSTIPVPENIPEAENSKISDYIKLLTGSNSININFALNGGNDLESASKKTALERQFLSYAISQTYYLPSKNPESFVWANMQDDPFKKRCYNIEPKEFFKRLTGYEKGRMDYETVSSEEILETQVRRLAQISDNHPEIKNLAELLKEFLE